jgi:hypothetical protein
LKELSLGSTAFSSVALLTTMLRFNHFPSLRELRLDSCTPAIRNDLTMHAWFDSVASLLAALTLRKEAAPSLCPFETLGLRHIGLELATPVQRQYITTLAKGLISKGCAVKGFGRDQ